MARPTITDDNRGLMPWKEVARRVGVSPREVQRIAARALAKIRVELVRQGVDEKYLASLAKSRVPRIPPEILLTMEIRGW